MVRYRRYKRRYSGTRAIKMKFQSFMDISTSDSSMQVITISAGGPSIVRRLAPMFSAYKYYKIGKVSCKLVPASTLPVDPTGLSYEAGENTVDPRDQLTPGMMRITNGEDIFEDISSLTENEQIRVYNSMLLDPRWFKWMLQSGVKRYASPRYWQIGQLHQDKWPGATINYPVINGTTGTLEGTGVNEQHFTGSQTGGTYSLSSLDVVYRGGSSPEGFFQTGHRGVLGWLPTDSLDTVTRTSGAGGNVTVPSVASPPEIEVMKIILPKAFKTRYYYRMFITETVYFKEPIVNLAPDNYDTIPLDIFHTSGKPYPHMPGGTSVIVPAYPDDENTGGNYGDD